jgi:hypothetical protein
LALFERDRSNKGKRAAKAAREKTLIDGIGEQGAIRMARSEGRLMWRKADLEVRMLDLNSSRWLDLAQTFP